MRAADRLALDLLNYIRSKDQEGLPVGRGVARKKFSGRAKYWRDAIKTLEDAEAIQKTKTPAQRHQGGGMPTEVYAANPLFAGIEIRQVSAADKIKARILSILQSRGATKSLSLRVSLRRHATNDTIDAAIAELTESGCIVCETTNAIGRPGRVYRIGDSPRTQICAAEPKERLQFNGEVFDSIADIAAMVRRERLLDDTISGTLPDPVDQEAEAWQSQAESSRPSQGCDSVRTVGSI